MMTFPAMQLSKLFGEFFNSERVGGILLLFCTALSLILANSAFGQTYLHFWHQPIDLSFAGLKLNLSLEQWINDGLMTVFFLLVGLEIERELYVGELSTFGNAILPLAGAVGGMLVPALIHFLLNGGTFTQRGFGIPMATDIAFALGMLALAGDKVPFPLKVFLAALAIIDDLGAILVIAVFYSSGIQWTYLGVVTVILICLFFLREAGVKKLLFYLLPAPILWYCTLQSGIHPTIAGVLLAFAIPFSGKSDQAPSYKLQHFLHKPVNFLIVPLFALANTGILLKDGWLPEMLSTNSLGIMAGLVLGKPLGILAFCGLVIFIFKSKLPDGVRWSHLAGAAVLAGIGFTMSIFISNLAFSNPELVSFSKIAVLIGSLVATVAGLLIFWSISPMKRKDA